MVSVNVSVVFHMSGVFHVVTLSIIRFISLKQLLKIQSLRPWFSYNKCLRTILFINISVALFCVPFFFNSEVREVPSHIECSTQYPEMNNLSAHELGFTIIAMNTVLGRINFWLLGTICKLIPCTLLVIMSVLLIQKLREIHLLSIRFTSPTRERRHRRITYIILIIMVLFVVVELPQGVLSVLTSLVGVSDLFADSEFIGDLFDILSLLNSCATFGLFCAINSCTRNALARKLSPLNHKRLQRIAHLLVIY
ncbi:unnamed protein product [Thelazia callipaeda]|uniref:G_PROTEIN_RECEP_F1_2 domain-containing protein n=1 Tax=Thelazia callipaeda TaxID=103827 RepID=A0A0N5CPL1_THECL|nr:unnamed protein product [Thelazia callipaeda]